jgi:hypothetical protein
MNLFHPMWYAFVAMQAGIPTLLIGMPGCAKTACAMALAKALRRRFVPLIGSQCSPEDVSGLPVPDHVKFLCRMMPMAWSEALLTPGGLLFLDEWGATGPAVHAAMLTVIQDKRVGDLPLDADTLMLAAMNPIEVTPNGTPLSLPTANRFFIADWVNDRESFLTGLATCEWDAPSFPVLPEDWKTRVPKWGAMFQSFLRRTDMVNVPPTDDTQLRYPTERTWRNAVMCCAAAEAAGADMFTDQSNVRLMVAGNVGDVAADQFCQFKSTLDIADPLDILDGKVTFTHRESRPDITMTVLAALATTVSTAATFTPERWDAAATLFGEIGKTSHPELVLRWTRILLDATAKFKHSPNAKVLKPLVEMSNALKSVG